MQTIRLFEIGANEAMKYSAYQHCYVLAFGMQFIDPPPQPIEHLSDLPPQFAIISKHKSTNFFKTNKQSSV